MPTLGYYRVSGLIILLLNLEELMVTVMQVIAKELVMQK